MTEKHLAPARAHATAREDARARSRQLAGELTRLGVPAEAAPGGDRAGVWLDGDYAELTARVLQRSAAQGEISTREHFGLPPAAAMPAEFAPDPEYQPDPGPVSEQMLEDAMTVYEAQARDLPPSVRSSRKGMIAALTAAGLWDDALDWRLLEAALEYFRDGVPAGSSTRDRMMAALTAVLARIPPPAGFADDAGDGERPGAGRAELEEGIPAGRLHDTRGNIKVTCPRGCGQLIWQGAHDGLGGCSAGTAASAAAYPDIIVDEPAATTPAGQREQLIRLVSGALHEDIRVSHEQVRQFRNEAGSFTWYPKTLVVARRWVTIRSPGQAGLPAPVTGDPDAHDQRLRDGWATWEQVLADAPGKHEHAHTCGPFFAHKHPGGDTPHDHRPDDTRIPAAVRREYRHSQEGRPL